MPVDFSEGLLPGSLVEDGQSSLGLGRIEPQIDTIQLRRAEIDIQNESQGACGRYHLFHTASFSDWTPFVTNG